jgi:hypothetical protein
MWGSYLVDWSQTQDHSLNLQNRVLLYVRGTTGVTVPLELLKAHRTRPSAAPQDLLDQSFLSPREALSI